MNRYSFFFAAIVAASFVAPTPQAGDAAHPAAMAGKKTTGRGAAPQQSDVPFAGDPNKAVQDFLQLGQTRVADQYRFGTLFAAVPHPTETNLAADFDENIAALESGLQEAGYLFDSVWMPWHEPRDYDRLEDNLGDQGVRDKEDEYPGILFFRKDVEPDTDPYASGLIVFLITEKPTAGLSVKQVQNAISILTANGIPVHMPRHQSIGIIGPSYTGSLGSLGPVLLALHGADKKAPFLIRSGVFAGDKSGLTIERLTKLSEMSGVSVDFASSHHHFSDWTSIAVKRLIGMGICPEEIAFLSEDESSYGSLGRPVPANTENDDTKRKGAVLDNYFSMK